MKYRLKKDLPGIKAGSEVEVIDSMAFDTFNIMSASDLPTTDVMHVPLSEKDEWIEGVSGRWKPEEGETYFFIGSNGKRARTAYRSDADFDRDAWAFGNCFRTNGDFHKACNAVRETLMKCHEEV